MAFQASSDQDTHTAGKRTCIHEQRLELQDHLNIRLGEEWVEEVREEPCVERIVVVEEAWRVLGEGKESCIACHCNSM